MTITPEMQEVIDMLKDLQWSWYTEISNLYTLCTFKEARGKDKRYFCSWMKNKPTKRCEDSDFQKKKYFYVDLDIRKDTLDKTWKVIDDNELYDIIFQVSDRLESLWLWDYSYAVMSGNWLHLYYVCKEIEISKEDYRDWASYFFDKIDDALQDFPFKCDRACVNIARISRLPWSINSREKFWLEPTEVKLLVNEPRESSHYNNILEYAELRRKEQEKSKDDIQEVKRQWYNAKSDDDLFKKINEIPAWEVIEKIRGLWLKDRNHEVLSIQENWQNIWAYIYKPKNVIVSTGSSKFITKDKVYTVYRFVRDEQFSWDVRKTLERFKINHWIDVEQRGIIPEKREYKTIGYVYGDSVFDPFECLMSGELCVLVAKTNSWKTTFAMNILQANAEIGKKWFYVNLEFDIRTVAKHRWMAINGKTKRNLTDLDPLDEEEQYRMEKYIEAYLRNFDYYNNPEWLDIDELVELLLNKQSQWYNLFVIDTFSRIKWNLDEHSRWSQNKTMEKLMALCENTWMCIILLHHTNKKGEFEGSQKIQDLARVFITVERDNDPRGDKTTTFTLTKDKFVNFTEIEAMFQDWKYLPFLQ